jgi:hypothetical protein
MEFSGQIQAAASLAQETFSLYQLYVRLVWIQSLSLHCEEGNNFLSLPGVQHVACLYTDWATTTPLYC